MSRPGSNTYGLLDELHATGCDGKEYGTCEAKVVPAGGHEEPAYWDENGRGAEIVVVYMAWCGECGAADWEVV